jgi:hypothetical protein
LYRSALQEISIFENDLYFYQMNKRKQRQANSKQLARDTEKAQLKSRITLPPGAVAVNESLLAPYNSYGAPDYVIRGYYIDTPFRCASCGKEEIWKAAQQKWWYEVAKGYVYSTAKLCRNCRRSEQARKAQARQTHLNGLASKKSAKP